MYSREKPNGIRTSAIVLAVTASLFYVSASHSEEDGLPIAILEDGTEVSFEKQILPVLRANCLACHNVQEAESDLVLETPQAILEGGGNGSAVVAGNAAASLLFQLAAHRDEPVMPPEDNDVGAKPLSPSELALLKLWIDQGARGAIQAAPETIDWRPVPHGFAPIYAVAVSPHGQLVAAGRGNQIAMYDVAARREVGRLADESLAQVGGYADAKAAHLDVVQSLAFSPDGERLASGGFRCVKLWRRARPRRELAVTLGLTPTAVAIHDSNLAVATPEGEIHICDLQSGQIASTLKSSAGAVNALSFIGGGKQLLTTSFANQVIRNWNLQDASIIQEIDTPAPIVAMAVLANDEYVVTAGADGVLRVRQIGQQGTSGTEAFLSVDKDPVHEIPAGDAATITLVALAERAQCITASEDGSVRFWDAAGGQPLRDFQAGEPLQAVAVSPSGQRLATLTKDGTTKLWNADGKLVKQLPHRHQQELLLADTEQFVELEKQRHQGSNADLEAVRKRLADEEQNVKKSEEDVNKAIETAKQKAEVAKKPLQEKTLAQEAFEIAKSDLADKQKQLDEARQQLEAADDSNKQQHEKEKNNAESKFKQAEELYKQAEEQLKKRTAEAEKAVAESGSAEKAIDAAKGAAERAKQVVQRVADEVASAETLAKQREEAVRQAEVSLAKTQESAKHSAPSLTAIAFSSDGWRLAATDDSGALDVFSAEFGDFIDSFEVGLVKHLVFEANGRAVVVAEDGSASAWSVGRPWQLESTIGNPGVTADFVDRVTSLAFSPDGELLATGGGEPSRSGQLKLWRVANGELVADIKDAHSDVIFDLSFSPDGKQLASCGADRMMKLFDVSSGKFLQAFEGHTGHVLGVAWKADGRMLATSGADNVVKIWDAKTGSQNKSIAGFKKEITALRYLGLEDRIVFSAGDGQVASRNSNGDGRPGFPGASDFVYSVRCSDNGQLVAAGGQDGYLRIWNSKGEKLLEFPAAHVEQ